MKTKWWAVVLIVLCTLFTSSAQFFFKLGSARLPEIITNWPIFTGITLYALGAIILIISFKGGDVTVLYPIISTSYIWVALISWKLFSENLNVYKWVGIAIIIIGISMIGLGSKQTSSVKYVEVP
jgi:undecaprenyl phosphate-alpha-L-ara4N flippase subunit ArnE